MNAAGDDFAYDSRIVWDSANGRLGIGTAAPGYALDVPSGEVRFNGRLHLNNGLLHHYTRGVGANSAGNPGWYRLGYFYGTAGARFTMRLLGNSGYGRGSANYGEVIVFASVMNAAASGAPNISGASIILGGTDGEMAWNFRAVQIGTNPYQWEIRAQMSSYSSHAIHVDTAHGNWEPAWAASSNPGSVSATVAHFPQAINVQGTINFLDTLIIPVK